jgi:hypothetical protein
VYQASGDEQIVPIEPPLPEADADVPMPRVVANEHEATIAYWTAPEQRRVAVVRFRPAYVVLFGSPNDEALRGHRTFECIADVVEATLPDAAGPTEALAALPLWGD